ncbi:MAG: hypothetical protein WD825_02210 [Gemmatimonadaceae bacterium]
MILSPQTRLAPIAVAGIVFLATLALLQPLPVGSVQDDGLYVILGKALATGEGYRFINLPGAPAAVHYPPGYPTLLAILWAIFPRFPANTVLFAFANIALLSVAAGATFHLGRRLDLPPMVATGCALAGFLMLPMLALGLTLVSEPLWLALAIPWLLRADRETGSDSAGTPMRWTTAAGLGAAAGVLMLVRTQSIALLVGLIAALLVRRRAGAAAAALVGALLVAFPWQLWVAHHADKIPDTLSGKYGAYSTWLRDGLRAEGLNLLTESMRRNIQSAQHFVSGMLSLPGLPSAISGIALLGPAVAGGVRLARRTPVLFSALCAHAALILLLPFEPQRYVWGSWPFVILWIGAGLMELWERWRAGRRAGPGAPGAAIRRAVETAAFAGGILVIAGAAVSTGIGLYRQSYRNVALGGAHRLLPTVEWVERHTQPDALIASDDETAVFLYTGRRAVPATSFLAANYVRPTVQGATSFQLDTILALYRPDLVIVNWQPTVAAALRLSTGSAPVLRPVASLPSGGVFARVK